MIHSIDISNDWKYSSKNRLFKGTTNLPTCNYLDLLKDKFIGDPFFGENEGKLFWVSELDWTYEKSFEIRQDELQSKIVRIHFESIDTIADIYLNDELLDSVKNAHIPYDYDVKSKLKVGLNTLSVHLTSPVNYVANNYKNMNFPANFAGVNRFTTIRKAAYQFGWDWGPKLPCSGFDGRVYILCSDGDLISDLRVEQALSSDFADLSISATIERYCGDGTVTVTDPDGLQVAHASLTVTSERDVFTCVSCSIRIENPKLWHANGMKLNVLQQPLYTLTLNSGATEKSINIGIRELSLSTLPDKYGKDFCFIVNGKRIFGKGANWIPADSFPARVTNEQIEVYIKAMADANFNMIRVWGGGFYASDYFMDLCDRYGILVWHDFMFACGLYPFRKNDFLQSVTSEVIYQVKRLRTHPSLALLCGNNEIDAMSPGWGLFPQLLKDNKLFFYTTMPSVIEPLTSCRYWPTSPSVEKGIKADNAGDTHIWAVWHGMMPFTYFMKRNTRFCSEFGFESLPPVDTLLKIANNPKELDLNSSLMKSHQKCGAGNARILYYIINNYRIPKRYDHLTYLSQLTQAESVEAAVDHWHRNLGRCNGSLYWQYNDCWHTASWSGIDYLGSYKALHYYAKDFYAPISVSFYRDDNDISVYAVNDSTEEFSCKLLIKITDFDGDILFNSEIKTTLASYSANKIETVSLSRIPDNKINKTAMIAELFDDSDTLISRKTTLFTKDNEAVFKKAQINVTVEEDADHLNIRLKANTYVRKIMLNIAGLTIPFSVNYFDMEPSREYSVKLSRECNLSAAEVKSALQLISYADIEPKYSRKIEKLKASQIALIPINFFGRIAYKFL
ncbi:MAG: hypothetical protein LBE09_05005 [Christensenellaceae bacterium]|jgi:beta-mannosidase|nr:hypothetical protein [Christensenellaceae bacterium]